MQKLSPANCQDVPMGCYGVTTPDSDKYILASYGAGPCILASFYNKDTKTALLSHISPGADLSSLDKILEDNLGDKNIDANLYAGLENERLCSELRIRLNKNKSVSIKNDKMGKEQDSLAIDSKTGEVSLDYFMADQISSNLLMVANSKQDNFFATGERYALAKSFDGKDFPKKDYSKEIEAIKAKYASIHK